MFENRKDIRLYTHEVTEYCLCGRKPGDYCIGVTHNVSKSGTCLYLLDEVLVGDKITFRRAPESFHEKAVVQWVKKVQDEIYVAGMTFA